MSGSPIVQNGKLVGAVTHVFVNDPTRGYGIFIENMLAEAEKIKRYAGEHVAGLKRNRHVPDGKAVYGVYKGVRVGVIRTNGKIATVFPDADQSSVLKKRRK